MLRYEIEGGSLPVVICYPEAGQTLCTERGSMSWMSPNMQMDTNSGGGLKKALGRMFSGDSIFLNEYTPVGGAGMIAFSSSFPGRILPFEVAPGNGIIIQKRGFLAMEKGLDLSIYLQKKAGVSFFGGEGFIMQKVSGSGLVFLEIDGFCKEYTLQAGQTLVVDTGHVAAMTEGCQMEIETVKGAKNIFFGGEGLFLTKITGPGKVWLQSMPIVNVAGAIQPYLKLDGDSSSGNGINIKFGE